MKRILLVIALLLAVLMLFAACGKDGPVDPLPDSGNDTSESGTTEITAIGIGNKAT